MGAEPGSPCAVTAAARERPGSGVLPPTVPAISAPAGARRSVASGMRGPGTDPIPVLRAGRDVAILAGAEESEGVIPDGEPVSVAAAGAGASDTAPPPTEGCAPSAARVDTDVAAPAPGAKPDSGAAPPAELSAICGIRADGPAATCAAGVERERATLAGAAASDGGIADAGPVSEGPAEAGFSATGALLTAVRMPRAGRSETDVAAPEPGARAVSFERPSAPGEGAAGRRAEEAADAGPIDSG